MEDFDWGGMASSLANLYGQYQGARTARNVQNQVNGLIQPQQAGYQNQLNNLMEQIQTSQAAAAAQYAQAQQDYGAQNQGLQNDIGNLTSQLSALSDPNSAYMQMARQAIERKDAAAGRRSQWGDREVQLAGTLADYVGKYAPGLQNSITAARNQITSNNNSLANIFNTMNMSADRNNIALGNLLTGMNSAANTANTTGRQAANSATNNTTGMLNSLFGVGRSVLGGLGGLSSLWGNATGGADWGTSNGFDWNANNANDTSGLLYGLGIGSTLSDDYWGNMYDTGTGDPYAY